MSKATLTRATEPGMGEARYRPLYARALGLRYLHPGGMLCFVYLEGAVALGLLLALAELVSWWVVLILPVAVALMVKINDLVAGVVARSAALTPERERERVRQEVIAFMPTVGLAPVSEDRSDTVAALTEATAQLPIAVMRDESGKQPDRPDKGAGEGARGSLTEATAQYPIVPQPGQDIDPAAAGRRDTAGRYAQAGRYLDAAWRQHAYATAHTKQADPTTQHERQSATRRYE